MPRQQMRPKIDDLRRFNISRNKRTRHAKEPQVPAITRAMNAWWERLLKAIFDKDFSGQVARYEENKGRRDYVFNSVGQGLWGALFPVLTIASTQLVGPETAGMFTMAFVVANLLQNVGSYAVRTYQVSDQGEASSFSAYEIQRVICLVGMAALGLIWLFAKGYTGTMYWALLGTTIFRMLDSLSDVYEGRLQQCNKLYLAGISIALRCALAILLFSVSLLITRSIIVASIALAIAAAVSTLFVTIPLTLFECPRSRRPAFADIKEIFVECAPAFIAQFFFALIEAAPKFVMEGTLDYEAQLYFNTIYFPAQATLMIVGLLYKPQLVRLSVIWQDSNKRRRFDLLVFAIFGMCAVVTLGMLAFFASVGIPLNSLLYHLSFENYRTQQYSMIVAGGLSACVEVLTQIITMLRVPSKMSQIFTISLAFVGIASALLIPTLGFNGAVFAYFAVMVVLFVLLLINYFQIRTHATQR